MVGIIREQVVIDLAVDLHGSFTKSHVFKLNLALANLVVAGNIIIHDLDGKFHVVEGRNVPNKGLAIDRVGLILLVARLFVALLMVKEREE